MHNPPLNEHGQELHAGDWVEVKSREEILSTLDESGRLEALPFMPEMLQFCGKRFRVFKSAHKTCDTIETYKGRRMESAVHLEGLRCDGEAHGGCQAQCLLFWKEAWLVRAPDPGQDAALAIRPSLGRAPDIKAETENACDVAALDRGARQQSKEADGEVRYSCQATELVRATTPLAWWEPWCYVKDIKSGNVRPSVMIRFVGLAAVNTVARFILRWIVQPKAWLHPFPYMRGLAKDKPPIELLNLQPGELVEVRSKSEIMRTLGSKLRNRGLSFDVEAVQYCGKTFRVRSRVTRIINEKTGAMMNLANDCIILEGATCSGNYSCDRLFCPRSIYPYWREMWLKRVKQ